MYTGFLSSSWHVETRGAFAASCIGVALLAVLLEFCRRLGKEYDGLIARQFQVAARRQSRIPLTAAAAGAWSQHAVHDIGDDDDEPQEDEIVATLPADGKTSCCASKKQGCPPDEQPPAAAAIPAATKETSSPSTRTKRNRPLHKNVLDRLNNYDTEGQRSSAAAAGRRTLTFRASPIQQLIRALIHAVTFGLAYIIMLLAMYFNGYIIISIILGAGVGKFLCDWMIVQVALDPFEPSTAAAMSPTSVRGIEEPTICCG